MSLAYLPDDVLLLIYSYLAIQDVLALKQTCRGLHAFGSTDYLWHRLVEKSDLPLDVPADTPSSQLPSDVLQRLAVKAIRLQLNWRRPTSEIKRTTSLPGTSDALFEFLQFVPGGRWLLVVQGGLRRFEHRNYTRVSFWDLSIIEHPRCVVMFEFTGKHRGSAVALRDGESLVTIVVALNDGGSQDFMQVRSVSIDDTMNALDPMSPLPSIVGSRRLDLPPQLVDPRATALIEGISVWENQLVATVALIVPDQEIKSHIMIANTDKGHARWMRKGPDQPIPLPQARLQNDRMIVFGYSRQDFVVRIHDLPCWLNQRGEGLVGEDVAWGRLREQYSFPLGSNLMDTVHIPSVSASFLTIMVFNEADPTQPSAQIVRFPLDDSTAHSGSKVTNARVPLPLDTSIRSVSIGTTGRRAVWMEHNLDTTRTRLMKLELGSIHDGTPDLSHGVLLPADPPLPFATDACHSLAFDEATCRLCLGLWDSSLHVVDFAS
ncbi:F-box protein [Phanerochaete sordida]|uniref:F-box protein n=1 Tax=Phanerochaete sordida TaxID=48140 RepID=A0A9P3G423_9APHY|nr:F-box protein [Phanerochaete sordida]